MLNRRGFFGRTIGGGSLLALGAAVPEFLSATAHAADSQPQSNDNILVLVEMAGGNDGLNTVVPVGDELYHKARPTLASLPSPCSSVRG